MGKKIQRQRSALQHFAIKVRLARASLERWAYLHGLLSATRLSLPDFLGIGAQKAGTTWLEKNLRCHPEIFLPEQKELHYFDRNLDRSLGCYVRNFRPGVGRVKGEITPSYSILPAEQIRLIRTLMPRARLILLLRHPVDRAWSHARMRLMEETGRSLEEIKDAAFYRHFERSVSRRLGSYPTILDNWLAVFPADQLYVGFYEDVTQAPRELLAEVFGHLGVSGDVDWDRLPYRQVIHRGVAARMPDHFREFLEDLYRDEIEELSHRFGERISPWRSPRR